MPATGLNLVHNFELVGNLQHVAVLSALQITLSMYETTLEIV